MVVFKVIGFGLLASVLFGCATYKPMAVKQHCQLGICLIYMEPYLDTDGDGFSDADERAAGTDPFDRDSYPSIKQLTRLIVANELPSYRHGMSELVVLPTTTPDGRTFLPPAWTVDRKSALERLGLTDAKLQTLGLAGTSGFRIQLEHPSSASESVPFTGFRVGGIPISLISDSNGSGLTAKQKDFMFSLANSRSEGEGTKMKDFEFRTFKTGGVTLDIVWPSGDQIQVAITRPGQVKITKNDNDLTSSSIETITIKDSKGNDGANVREEISHTVYDDGSKTDYVSTTTSLNRPDGSGYVNRQTTTTTTDKDGKLVSKNTVETTVTKDADGSKETTVKTTKCLGDDPCTTTAEVKAGLYDPEVAGTMVVPTLAEMKKVVEARGGSNTTPGPVQDGPVLNTWPIVRYGGLSPLIIHLDPDYQSFLATGTPRVDRAQPEVVPGFPTAGDH